MNLKINQNKTNEIYHNKIKFMNKINKIYLNLKKKLQIRQKNLN